jgi:ATP-dependent Clp protease adaptor protein ClpS
MPPARAGSLGSSRSPALPQSAAPAPAAAAQSPRWTSRPIGGKVSSVADVGYIAIIVAGFGAYWWRHLRPRRRDVASEVFTPDAEVALHVAVHEAGTRRQSASSIHLLYGLLQDEAVTAAIATAGGDPDQLEDRVLAALTAQAGPGPGPDEDDQVIRLAGRAVAFARHGDRRASCTDLWAALAGSPAARLIDDSKLDRGGTLFALFHGGRAPDIALPDGRDVLVVLRNDHYTTQQFVCSMLRDVFALTDADASAIMLATHTTGRAVIGRFTATAARDRIAAARDLARRHAFPLWIGVEPT